jgi:HAD superfamily hydrolase (TIGR01509 family)
VGERLYIFDMGGVVIHNADVFPQVIRYLRITGEEFFALAGKNLKKLYDGKISTDEFWARFSRRYGRKIEEDLFSKFFHPSLDREMVNLIMELKDSSRVVCGTNTFDPHYDYLLSRGYYDIFNAVFSSNKIGVSKPDPNFYAYILRHEEIMPENAFFVDDTEANVISASNMGITSILYTDSDSLSLHIKSHT